MPQKFLSLFANVMLINQSINQSINFLHLNQFALNQHKLIKLVTAHKKVINDFLFLIFGSYDLRT